MIFETVSDKYRNLSLFRKIMILFCIILSISITLTSLLFWRRYHELVNAEMNGIAQRNANLIAGNIDTMIDTASYNSKLLLANTTVQSLLRENTDFGNVYTFREMQNAIGNFMNITPHISAIYIFDTNGHNFGVDNYTHHDFSFDRIEQTVWYQSVLDQKGYYIMLVNSGENKKLNGDQNVISLVRNIYNLDEVSRLIGTVMLNMRESLFTSCFTQMVTQDEFFVTVVDRDFKPVLSGGNDFLALLDPIHEKGLIAASARNCMAIERGRKIFFASQKLQSTDWYVITAMPYAEHATPVSGFNRIYWLFMLLIVFLLFFAATIINRLFTTPIRQLTDTMKCVGNGEFRKAEMLTGNDEIGLLKNTYNAMIGQIETLVIRIRDEEERKRIAELHALQMQIKPHFLYNTIDTARSMVLSGRTQEVNTLLRSLGQFYRNSICRGKDVITLAEEIDMVKNYLIIQKMRYGDLIEAEYDIDETLLSAPMLKLVIQPLVENAIYHGIRPSGHNGIISIRVWKNEEELCISVTDNGEGMTREKLDSIMTLHQDPREGEHIGLCGTMDRLRLFRGTDRPLDIRSDPGFGTCVTVHIPPEAHG